MAKGFSENHSVFYETRLMLYDDYWLNSLLTFLFTSTFPLPGFIVCCVLISAPLALSNTLNVLSTVEVDHVLCLQTIGASLRLPVVKGKPSQLALLLPAEL